MPKIRCMDDPLTPAVLPDDDEFAARLVSHVKIWSSQIPVWNGRVTAYNPSGRRFTSRELRLMAQQEAFDETGVSGFVAATTADELLERARAVAALARDAEESGPARS